MIRKIILLTIPIVIIVMLFQLKTMAQETIFEPYIGIGNHLSNENRELKIFGARNSFEAEPGSNIFVLFGIQYINVVGVGYNNDCLPWQLKNVEDVNFTYDSISLLGTLGYKIFDFFSLVLDVPLIGLSSTKLYSESYETNENSLNTYKNICGFAIGFNLIILKRISLNYRVMLVEMPNLSDPPYDNEKYKELYHVATLGFNF